MEISFTSLAVVGAAAFAAPLLVGLVPSVPLPPVVLELVLGILIGRSVLGWATDDEPVQVLAMIGLSFLLLIAGREVDYDRLRGRLLRVTGLGFLVALALGLGAGLALHAGGIVRSPLLVTINVLRDRPRDRCLGAEGRGAGQDMGLIGAANAAAVIAAGLLSVLLFPAGALSLLRTAVEPREAETPSLAATQH